ncbi:MAG: IPExxxVDY family protein [Prevotellaceae bacterium]|jgi:hypothetical protein|nr:IPExxxVDY family protein [Prevotellaceae bacterium]
MKKQAKKTSSITIRDFAEDVSAFSLLAIRSTETDTRLAWLLNRALHLDFVHCKDLCGKAQDSPQHPTLLNERELDERRQFAVFHAADSLSHRSYHLIANRQDGEPLIKKMAQVDYLLKISEALQADELAALSATIRAISGVQACIAVSDELKNNPQLVTLEA